MNVYPNADVICSMYRHLALNIASFSYQDYAEKLQMNFLKCLARLPTAKTQIGKKQKLALAHETQTLCKNNCVNKYS